MVAVLIEIDLRGMERDVALTELHDQNIPAITSLPGFQSGTWLAGNGYGKGVVLTLWDTEDHAKAMLTRFGVGKDLLWSGSVVRAEVREVAATA